uniref:FYVE-type domain-containing protein n=1 Tax=Hyaloperonospora arabidopsidis (strain Emoy2) TaxID=559515 RepID=M4BET7_HYAAE
MATQFIVVGGAVNAIAACEPMSAKHECDEFWDLLFCTLHREADGVLSKCDTPSRRQERQESVAEMEELIQVAVQVFEKDGAQTLQQSFADHEEEIEKKKEEKILDERVPQQKQQQKQLADRRRSSAGSPTASENDGTKGFFRAVQSPLQSPVNGELLLLGARERRDDNVLRDSTEIKRRVILDNGEGLEVEEPDDTGIPAPLTTEVNATAMYGIFGHDSANFASQILRYFAIRGQKGACILHYLADHPATVDMLLANVGHDDIRTLLLHLIYAEHSEAAITSLFETHMMQKLIQKQVTFSPPRNAFERDCIENTFMLLREIVHAPYLTGRGVAISAKTIPLDKITGQDEYVSICGASRETANSALRKYTSRKVRRLIHLFMQEHQAALELLFVQMMKELTFWSIPLTRERQGSAASLESLMLLSQGHPRPTCIMMLMHLFELTETIEFTDARSAGGNPATSVGIDCLNFLCSTHLMRKGKLLVKKKLKNELQLCQVSLNCMMGLRMTALREDQQGSSPSLDQAFTPAFGNQVVITLDEMESVQSSKWHNFGFSVTVKKIVQDACRNSSSSRHTQETPANAMIHHQRRSGQDDNSMTEVKSTEYFAASSEEEKQAWMTLLQAVIDGDLNELEIFCSDDWRSNVREYRRLRECLITCMERKGHELMVFLKQVITFNTRKVSGFHLWLVVQCFNSVLSNESKRLDRMFVGAHVITTLITCYEKYPMWNLLLGEITKMLIFCIGDLKNKRSRRCPIIGRILQTEGPDAKLAPLLCKVYLNRDTASSSEGRDHGGMVGTDAMSNLKLIMEALKMCYKDPKTRSQERIQCDMKVNPVWRELIKASDDLAIKDPSSCILTTGTPPANTLNSTTMSNGCAAPAHPTFQEEIINHIIRPSYSTAHGFGSSFLEGDGCAFGYLFKQRYGGREWKKALVVYEYDSHKLWYFYPSEVDETHAIKWKWIVPLSVRSRYTHGQDETHTSVGHHGLYIKAYDHQQNDEESKVSAKEMHFSVTKLEDRDLWKELLSKAADVINEMGRDYLVLSQKLKKPDKKTVTHCQDPTCKMPFKLFRRPHSCKRCGNWMCAKCASQRMSIPEVGLLHPVRHCRACFEAHGGAHAEVEPFNLFHLTPRNQSSTNGANTGRATKKGPHDGALSNAELYELAHGMVSPRTLMQMNRRLTRLSSIESPTAVENGGGFHVDEVDAPGNNFGTENLDMFADEEEEFTLFSLSVSRRSLLHPREDIRG